MAVGASLPGRADSSALYRSRCGHSALWDAVDSEGFGFAPRGRLFCAPLVAESGYAAEAVANYLRNEHVGLPR